MKKLGILAIGTLLFFAVSCDKNKNSYPPSTSDAHSTTSPSSPTKNTSPISNDLVDPVNSAEKVPGTRPGVRNDENINSNISDERTIYVRPIRNDMNDPFNDPRRLTKGRVRNDQENPNNDPR